MKSISNVGIYYINLDSQLGREISARGQLSQIDYPFERVSAISEFEICLEDVESKYWRLHSALKKSQVRACLKFLESEYDFALILEDDFIIDTKNIDLDLKYSISCMKISKINLLQMGYLGFDDVASKSTVEKYMRFIFERAFSLFFYLRNPFSKIQNNHIRWGSQAYLVDRKGAASLVDLIDIFSFSAMDAELRRIAHLEPQADAYIKVARLKKNLIRQNTQMSSSIQGVV